MRFVAFKQTHLLNKLSIIVLTIFFVSCRCSTDYKPISNNSAIDSDTTISASARMWQGQYQYLGIEIQIKRNDSLFVKSVSIRPALTNDAFFPKFNHFTMYSYYTGNQDTSGYKGQYEDGAYWQDYLADTFDKLPRNNRQTNKGSSYITYTAHYNSEAPINFKTFSADIEVLLINRHGNTISHRRHFDFKGEKKCQFSAH